MTVNDLMSLIRLYRKERKLAVAGERAKQIRAEIMKMCRVPEGYRLVPVDPEERHDSAYQHAAPSECKGL